MPAWTKESLSAPWPKNHDVRLAATDVYDAAVKAYGRNTLERHRPLGVVDQYGEKNRKAGTNGVYEPDDDHDECRLDGRAEQGKDIYDNWRERLKRGDSCVSVRDVKKASPECVSSRLRTCLPSLISPLASRSSVPW